MMTLMIRCVLYPNSHLFVTTGGKQQAASITIAKIQEICKLIPGLNNEINWDRGVSVKSKDNVKYVFKNGSTIDILAAKQSSRGQRRTGRNLININCPFKIAELSWKAEMLIRTEGYTKYSQGQRVDSEKI